MPTAGEVAGGFATQLRRAGLPIGVDRVECMARALLLIPPLDRPRLYWSARLAYVSDHSQLAVFDAVFAAVFDGTLDPADARGDPTAPPAVGSEARPSPARSDPRTSEPRAAPSSAQTKEGLGLSGGEDAADPAAPERPAVLAMASLRQRLGHVAFGDLTSDETAAIRALIRAIVLVTPTRHTRRSRPRDRVAPKLDVRRTVKSAQRHGGDVVRLRYRERTRRRRRLVLVCDVSGSMEPYTRAFLTLLQGAASEGRAEAFVFSTRLTRLTRQLAGRDAGQALARAAAATDDWAGGTRLASSLRRFIDDHGRRGLARGAVVVILSDGWSLDDPEAVGKQMARLRRLAHRIVWVNPRKAAPSFAPSVGGMAAALPYCDAFVSGHSLDALQEVAAAVRAT